MTDISQQRRKALQLFGVSSVAALFSDQAGAANCKNGAESTAGPYPDLTLLNRQELRANSSGNTAIKPGAPLKLKIRLVDVANGCAPIKNAYVDIWSADTVGNYSGYAAFGTTGQDFCRGYQKTDANGVVEFTTLFPGSYTGRAIHIHVAIQSTASRLAANAHGRNLASVFVCQLYFQRSAVDQVFNAYPIYRQGAAITPNEADSIYVNEGGAGYLVTISQSGSAYSGEVEIGTTRAAVGNPQDDTPPNATVLTPGVAQAINLNAKSSKLFTLTLTGAKTSLNFKLSGGSGDGDLYLQLGSAPSTSNYLRKSDGPNNTETISLSNPTAGVYYLLVDAYAAVSAASLVATVA